MDSQPQLFKPTSAASLAQLGQVIKDNAVKIEAFLADNNAARTDFTLGSPLTLDLPEELDPARQELYDHMEHLTAILRGPLSHIVHWSDHRMVNFTTALTTISRFSVAQHVPLDGSPIAISALATACHMQLSDLLPVLRVAIANRTFEAVGADQVRHNAASAAIASSADLRSWLDWNREDLIPAALRLHDAIAEWPGANDAEHAAFALNNPERLPLFAAAKSDPVRFQRIAGSMRLLGGMNTVEKPHLAETLQLQGLPEGTTVVDVGGSLGHVLVEVLREYKQLSGIVQDLPPVVAKSQVPDDLTGRLRFEHADFFEEQPQKGAAVYFLRKVLHDWSDEYAAKIIRNLVPALKSGSKVILNEICVPASASLHPRREQELRSWDLAMKWLLNGKEREEDEWKALFASVDERFTFVGSRRVPMTTSSIIEFLWKDPSSV